jgi:hypothetical protein
MTVFADEVFYSFGNKVSALTIPPMQSCSEALLVNCPVKVPVRNRQIWGETKQRLTKAKPSRPSEDNGIETTDDANTSEQSEDNADQENIGIIEPKAYPFIAGGLPYGCSPHERERPVHLHTISSIITFATSVC